MVDAKLCAGSVSQSALQRAQVAGVAWNAPHPLHPWPLASCSGATELQRNQSIREVQVVIRR